MQQSFSASERRELERRYRRVEPGLRLSIRELRESMGWSQTALAQALEEVGLKLDPTAVTRIESGKRAVRADELWALAVVFRVQLVDVLGDSTTIRSASDRLEDERRRLQDLEDQLRVRREDQQDLIAQLEHGIVRQRELIADLEREIGEDR